MLEIIGKTAFDLLCEGKREEALELLTGVLKGANQMLECDGYKMFYGTVKVTPVNGRPPFDLTGTWLWKPDMKCWYCKPDGDGITSSWPPAILSDFRVV